MISLIFEEDTKKRSDIEIQTTKLFVGNYPYAIEIIETTDLRGSHYGYKETHVSKIIEITIDDLVDMHDDKGIDLKGKNHPLGEEIFVFLIEGNVQEIWCSENFDDETSRSWLIK